MRHEPVRCERVLEQNREALLAVDEAPDDPWASWDLSTTPGEAPPYR
jgi:hypothetical protein